MGRTQPAAPFLPYYVPAPTRRPAVVLVLMALGLVLAVLGGFSDVADLILYGHNVVRDVPASAVVRKTRSTWKVVFALGGLALWVALVRACVVALRMKPRGRLTLVRWAWAFLAWALLTVAVECLVVAPVVLTQVPDPARPSFRRHMYRTALTRAGLAAMYPVALLALMTRPRVRAAFEGPPAPATAAGDVPAPVEAAGPLPPVAGRAAP